MSLTDIFKRKPADSRTSYVLTPAGKKRIESSETPGTKYRVLLSLYEHDASTAEDIAEETGIPVAQVTAILNANSPHYVRTTG